MKRGDVILIVALALLSLTAFLISPRSDGEEAVFARLKVDGVVVCEISEGEYRWEEGDAFLCFRFEDGCAQVLASSCPDQLCVRQGKICGVGSSAICLPNHAVVELVGASAPDAVV